jgi:antitoxin component of MazEF toxin-antitoxin module
MLRKIFKTGHSLAITVSRQALQALGLGIGDSVNVAIDAERHQLIVKPDKKGQQQILDLNSRLKLGGRLRA